MSLPLAMSLPFAASHYYQKALKNHPTRWLRFVIATSALFGKCLAEQVARRVKEIKNPEILLWAKNRDRLLQNFFFKLSFSYGINQLGIVG
jgi:hypothetical protein